MRINPTTLFWTGAGPRIRYWEGGLLEVNDLNPEKEIKFTMSHSELFWFGWECIKAAFK